MGSARAIGSAAFTLAFVACTYDVPGLVDAGVAGDAGSSIDGAPAGGGDSAAPGDGSSSGGASGSGSGSGSGGASSSGIGDGAASDAPCSGILCACSADSDCSTRVCARELTVGSPLYAAAGSRNFCTRTCCTSADCDPGTVCFGSGQGGNYCVSPGWLGRSSPGGSVGGTSCTTGTQCRSGLCAGGGCADTCCSYAEAAQECTNGTTCRFGNFPGAGFDTHFTARCGPPLGTNTYAEACVEDVDCQGGVCAAGSSGGGGGCTYPCRSASDCPAGASCLLDSQGGDIYAACFPWNGNLPQGAACSSDGQCVGGGCPNGSCSNVCFTDAECTTSGWHCIPQSDALPGGTYLVPVCGP